MRVTTLLHRLLLLTVLPLLSACQQQTPEQSSSQPAAQSVLQTERERMEARAQQVTIIRDDYGVPHIYAKTDADAVFGLMYAQSEDDFNRVERNYIWATGRLAEVAGEQALYSDLRARLFMTVAEAKAAYASAPDWLQELCDAFADGVNYYLLTHPEVQPQLLTRFEPWMPMFFSEGSIGGDIEQIPLAGIEAFYGGKPEVAVAMQDPDQEPRGSNGFAISGELTESGNAMLLINPHTSFYFRGEVHVISEQGLNAYGAVTWGQFFVYQGFNEHTGWMHTSTYVDFIDEFVEDIQDIDVRLMYRYGSDLLPVSVAEVTLKYKTDTGMSERTFPTYHTHHGPITHTVDGQWTASKINWDPINALKQSFTRTKTKNYAEFREMMEIRTNSSNNTVFADSSGNIAYFHGNFVPRRDPRFDYSQPVDGGNPATDWNGLHNVDETITLLNPANGWLQNANSTPFNAALEYSPKKEDYPVYMAPDPENFRGVHAVRVLRNANNLTLDKLIELAYDPALPGFEELIPALTFAYAENGQSQPELAPAIDILRNWNYQVSTDSVAMTLAHFFGVNIHQVGANPDKLSGMDLMNYFSLDTPPEELLQIFDQTIQQLNTDFGTWNTPWGEVNRFQRLTGDIIQPFDDNQPSLPVGMASGRWGALASFGAQATESTKKLYGTSGNSFVAVVEFGDRVKAKTLLAGGQSGDPASPHFDDQARRYVDREFKDVAYYQEDVEKQASKIYQPGNL